MLVPLVDLAASAASAASAAAETYISTRIVRLPDGAIALPAGAAAHGGRLYARAGVSGVVQAAKLLDAGAAKVVLEGATTPRDAVDNQQLPWDRLVVAVTVRDGAPALPAAATRTTLAPPAVAPAHLVDLMTTVAPVAAAVLLEFAPDAAVDVALITAVKQTLRTHAQLLVGGAHALATATLIAAVDKAGADTVLDAAALARPDAPLDLAGALTAALVSDRPDGLFATLVVDEHDAALGLVYSSVASVREALRTGRGVYQSRRHGLWHKGATSGATQDLLRIEADCDRDALKFVVRQHGAGFCHLETRTCFGDARGLAALEHTLRERKISAPEGSYTKRLFDDAALLRAKIIEEAHELCDAKMPAEVAAEAADVLYFVLTKCAAAGVTLADVENVLDQRALKVTRRPGNAKQQYVNGTAKAQDQAPAAQQAPAEPARIRMPQYHRKQLDAAAEARLLKRPIVESSDIMGRVRPIQEAVRSRGDAALLELTEKFDRVKLSSPVQDMRDPARKPVQLDPEVKTAIDLAMGNVRRFHEAQVSAPLALETMPGVVCSRFTRPIERVGLYVPGGTAILPSTAYMLGVPAKVAGCKEIILASPPGPDGNIAPEVEYIAEQIGASRILKAGGAQAVFAMAYGTESVPKVDKICGPGNQYVTAAKMLVQNDSNAMVAIDMPAGPSEVLVIADASANPAYVAADLLSQAEHGPDSQVVLLTVGLTDTQVAAIEDELERQGEVLPRASIVRQSVPKSFTLRCDTLEEAVAFSNAYAPEHLIVNIADPDSVIPLVTNAGSVFLGAYSSESCGDYASGTNHTLPTYGYARMYSGVNTATFLKHITSQKVSREGLLNIGDAVATLAHREGLEAHRNAVVIRLHDLRQGA